MDLRQATIQFLQEKPPKRSELLKLLSDKNKTELEQELARTAEFITNIDMRRPKIHNSEQAIFFIDQMKQVADACDKFLILYFALLLKKGYKNPKRIRELVIEKILALCEIMTKKKAKVKDVLIHCAILNRPFPIFISGDEQLAEETSKLMDCIKFIWSFILN